MSEKSAIYEMLNDEIHIDIPTLQNMKPLTNF